ncbi:DUF1840 domain-containing protein [Piscinibacter koreensis]|uniref:DUF1840 domain-containing protein n=1 Tax=Piscinibacter koreensis TaxID=2742824 RepID=A0A7Y6NKG9_9BURK|nr:DUF1840 domain-containing protein [Schlegelella koreensis]NUZ04858.1 DUF1840 domain-containing protein [Schlegelella koreensis]
MIYKFKSKAAGDLIMLEGPGEQVLRIVGKEPSPRGIIEAAALPAAIDAIERAIEADEARSRAMEGDVTDGDTATRDDDRADGRGNRRVTLRQRAWPMLEMMRRALAEKADITWGT